MTRPKDILKFDAAERVVYGFASVAKVNGQPVVDLQGDIIDPAELEKAAMEYMLEHRDSGVMHAGQVVGKAFASLVTTPELTQALFGIETDTVGWLLGVKYSDESVFKRVVKGELPMFSIEGSADRQEVAV